MTTTPIARTRRVRPISTLPPHESLTTSAPPSPFERRELRHLSAASQRDFWRFGIAPSAPTRHQRIHQAFEEWARLTPQAWAVSDSQGRALTYAELDTQADKVAQQLIGLGVCPADRVGVFLSRGIEMVVGILGTLKAGATWVPQDSRHASPVVLEHMVGACDIKVVLTTTAHAHTVPAAVPHVLRLDQPLPDSGPVAPAVASEHPAQLQRGHVPADQTAVVIFTSGTTGLPNGVEVTHANLVNIIVDGPAALDIRPGMRVAQILNIAFDMAVWEIFGALTHGATLVIRGQDIQDTVAQCDVVIATPSVLGGLDAQACTRVSVVAVAGERCPESLAHTWAQFATFHNSCGPTEVSIVNTVHRWTEGDEFTIGSPIPNTTVYVLDENLRPVEIGEIGEMWAGGACVTKGYLGNAELTEQRYRPDPFIGGTMFRTRDLVSWTPQGRLLHHGRTDDLVKVRGGFRVELDAVTSALESTPGVSSATTLCRDGVLIGFVTTPHRDHTDLAEQAQRTVAELQAYYYVPEVVVVVDCLPLTSRGKIDKRALLATLDAGQS